MNKIYALKYSYITGGLIAVSELAICQHMGIAVSGRYSDGSPEMKACR
ncbi:hypothetical protein C9224_22945, partial [Escherichia coli]